MRTNFAAALLVLALLPACDAGCAAQTPAAAPSAPASHTDTSALRREFEVLYARQAGAVMRQDADAVLAFDAPDFRATSLGGGSTTRAQLESRLRGFYTSGQLVRQISFAYEVLDVALRGGDAVVLVAQRDHRVQVRADGQSHDVEADVVHRDTWRRTPQGWLRYLTEEVRQDRFTVDGTPVAIP